MEYCYDSLNRTKQIDIKNGNVDLVFSENKKILELTNESTIKHRIGADV